MKSLIMVIGCLVLLAGAASTQEVVITDFPPGVAGSVDLEIFTPYLLQFQAIADTLKKDQTICAVVTGGADGQRYRQSHDAKNPSLALGRAHALRSVLMHDFGIDSTQIQIRTEEFKEMGPQYRYVSVRIEKNVTEQNVYNDQLAGLMARMDSLEARPAVEKHFTERVEAPIQEKESDLGIEFGAGASSSPFGGLPIVTAAFTYKRVVYVEGIFGHTWWSNNTFVFQGEELKTRRRQIGLHTIIYPFEDLPLGFLAGWLRVEEMAQQYYEYTKLSEGPVVGARITPIKHISLTAGYNPSKHRVATSSTSTSKNDQFLIYLTAHVGIGGAK